MFHSIASKSTWWNKMKSAQHLPSLPWFGRLTGTCLLNPELKLKSGLTSPHLEYSAALHYNQTIELLPNRLFSYAAFFFPSIPVFVITGQGTHLEIYGYGVRGEFSQSFTRLQYNVLTHTRL